MSKTITVFVSNTCPHCHNAKDYLGEKAIKFNEKNVQESADARKELMSMGIMAVPVIKIDEEWITGFDKERIDELLEL